MECMFCYASSFNHDVSEWAGTAATSVQTDMFTGATEFNNKYTCSTTNQASSCTEIKRAWISPFPPPTLPSYQPRTTVCDVDVNRQTTVET
ncbi:unknown protein [Bathycoccus prasinos]|uniref:Uncharacterized protein n=1 Tax=Bathycoccus prasinos TaxID=41875 RepID=K8ER41_9CHLO|nr:unknown protein [Bathycoccus prasinos]CCO20506.1 unknown protein [Bathycoccus prasinos]|eukprot:XP_007508402.1 unknown protein [Bathycoccus prasinos]